MLACRMGCERVRLWYRQSPRLARSPAVCGAIAGHATRFGGADGRMTGKMPKRRKPRNPSGSRGFPPKNWCPEEDSNLHALRHTDLNRARLPIPPSGPGLVRQGLSAPAGRVNSPCDSISRWGRENQKARNPLRMRAFCGKWCPEEDSNLHALRHTDLNRARLPIPPSGPGLVRLDVSIPVGGVNRARAGLCMPKSRLIGSGARRIGVGTRRADQACSRVPGPKRSTIRARIWSRAWR